jgi:hypothetical protein
MEKAGLGSGVGFPKSGRYWPTCEVSTLFIGIKRRASYLVSFGWYEDDPLHGTGSESGCSWHY